MASSQKPHAERHPAASIADRRSRLAGTRMTEAKPAPASVSRAYPFTPFSKSSAAPHLMVVATGNPMARTSIFASPDGPYRLGTTKASATAEKDFES